MRSIDPIPWEIEDPLIPLNIFDVFGRGRKTGGGTDQVMPENDGEWYDP